MININLTPCRNNYISFKAKEVDDDSCGFDDEVSKKRRDYIRQSYESCHLPYYDILENNGRLSEYQLSALIKRLCGGKQSCSHGQKDSIMEQYNEMEEAKAIQEQSAPEIINHKIMETLPLYNVKPIYSTNCYRGSTPNSNLDSIDILKQAGVKYIIDLQGYDRVRDDCEKKGMGYHRIPVAEDLSEMSAFKSKATVERDIMRWACMYPSKAALESSKATAVKSWEKDKNEYIEKFVKMINLLQEGNVYIGCEYGISRTNNAMLLNYLFNPKADKTPSCRTKFNNQYMHNIVAFYENLTPEHKAQMGWTQEFDENFMPRLKKLEKSPIEY